MTDQITIFGYGPTGQAIADRLRARGTKIIVAQRRGPATLPADVAFVPCDVLNADDVMNAMRGATQAVITTGFDYSGKVWRKAWPVAMANFIAAAETTGARIIQIDNLYMYGPQKGAIREDMALTKYGVKPAVRAQVTRLWQKASAEGRIRWAALRAPDFYGPGVDRSHLGDVGFGAIAKNQLATQIMPLDVPHAFAYVPDIGRAALSLLDAGDDVFGQAWHVPCAPTKTPREILEIGAQALGRKPRLMHVPGPLLAFLGLFVSFFREVHEIRFTWNGPYHVDSSKFEARFWNDPTPFEIGARATALSFAAATETPARNARQIGAPAAAR